jgi:methylated-DNA-protein-cysteine methyltransferase-like protein
MAAPSNSFDRLRAVVLTVPRGRVATYGQVSGQVLGSTPRMVGFALAGLPEDSKLPWHRIVNAAGRISLPPDGPAHAEQRRRLEAEGITFDAQGTIDLGAFGWR